MSNPPYRLGLVALSLLLTGSAGAQPAPTTAPTDLSRPAPTFDGDLDVTGSTEPRVIPAFPDAAQDTRLTPGRPGCTVQAYWVAPAQQVRVHRC